MLARLGAAAAALALGFAAARIGVPQLRAWDEDGGERGALARVDGVDVTAADLVRSLFVVRTEWVYSALEQAVRREVMEKDAEAAGVTVDAAAFEAEVARVLKAQSDGFELEAGPGRSFEAYLRQRYGIEPDVYRAAIRRQVLEQMLLARLVRHEARTRERFQARLLVVKDLEQARELRTQLAEGANFAALAKKSSVDASGAAGGLLAPVAVDTPHPLFVGLGALPAGALTEVQPLEKDGVTLFRLARIERRLPADPRPYAEQAAEVEADLAERAVDSLELAEWERRAREHHAIEVRLGRG